MNDETPTDPPPETFVQTLARLVNHRVTLPDDYYQRRDTTAEELARQQNPRYPDDCPPDFIPPPGLTTEQIQERLHYLLHRHYQWMAHLHSYPFTTTPPQTTEPSV